MDTNRLNPILDPLTIIASIISKKEYEDKDNISIIAVNSDIINISSLNNIRIILFRHQHILSVLIIIISNKMLILDFSTSKVDIFIKLLRTFVNTDNYSWNIIY